MIISAFHHLQLEYDYISMSSFTTPLIILCCFKYQSRKHEKTIHLIKTTAAQNEVALSYHRVRGLYFLAVVFVATM